MRHKGVNFPQVYDAKGFVTYHGKKLILEPLCEEYLVYWFRLKECNRLDRIVIDNFKHGLLKIQELVGIDNILIDKSIEKQLLKYGSSFHKVSKITNIVHIDNTKYIVNNMVDAPGIFIGKGNHPLRGHIKKRLEAKDITLNCSIHVKPPISENWKDIIVSNESYYIACWKDELFNKTKYIYATSDEEEKYNECYKLKLNIHKVRRLFTEQLTSTNFRKRQMACIVYMIDKFSFRVGHEKDDTSSDSVGCCTFLKSHVKINGDKLELDFFGKSYVRYVKKVKIDSNVLSIFKECLNRKQEEVFDISASCINTYLNSLLPGLTAKMFRTFNASSLCSRLLRNKSTVKEIKDAFFKVATLCNHQRKKNNEYVIDAVTTKRNYIDPRIIYAFTKRNNIKVNLVYNDSLIAQHRWASSVSSNFMY